MSTTNKKKTEEINLPPYDNAIMHNRLFRKPVLPQAYHNNTLDTSYVLHLVVSWVLMACVYVWLYSYLLSSDTRFRNPSSSNSRSILSWTRIDFLLRSPENSTTDVPLSFGRYPLSAEYPPQPRNEPVCTS